MNYRTYQTITRKHRNILPSSTATETRHKTHKITKSYVQTLPKTNLAKPDSKNLQKTKLAKPDSTYRKKSGLVRLYQKSRVLIQG